MSVFRVQCPIFRTIALARLCVLKLWLPRRPRTADFPLSAWKRRAAAACSSSFGYSRWLNISPSPNALDFYSGDDAEVDDTDALWYFGVVEDYAAGEEALGQAAQSCGFNLFGS